MQQRVPPHAHGPWPWPAMLWSGVPALVAAASLWSAWGGAHDTDAAVRCCGTRRLGCISRPPLSS